MKQGSGTDWLPVFGVFLGGVSWQNTIVDSRRYKVTSVGEHCLKLKGRLRLKCRLSHKLDPDRQIVKSVLCG